MKEGFSKIKLLKQVNSLLTITYTNKKTGLLYFNYDKICYCKDIKLKISNSNLDIVDQTLENIDSYVTY